MSIMGINLRKFLYNCPTIKYIYVLAVLMVALRPLTRFTQRPGHLTSEIHNLVMRRSQHMNSTKNTMLLVYHLSYLWLGARVHIEIAQAGSIVIGYMSSLNEMSVDIELDGRNSLFCFNLSCGIRTF